MPVHIDTQALDAAMERYRCAYLHAAGELVTDQAAENWNVRTGRGRNSVHYVTTCGERSEFGRTTGPAEGDSTPPEDSRLSQPQEPHPTVRVGSGLVYAGPHEKKTAWLSKAIDLTQSRLGDLAAAVARRFFQ